MWTNTINGKQESTSSVVKLHPYFITGFSDAECTFHVSITYRADYKFNWKIRALFAIGTHLEELPLLLSIQEYFKGVGYITKDVKNNEVRYTVTKIEDLINVIIPHFKSYPLLTKKKLDFILWVKIISIMADKKHLTEQGIEEIVSIRASLNKGLSSKIITYFPNIIPFEKPVMNSIEKISDSNWLVGFTAGDGSFSAGYINETLRSRFYITQHERDLCLLELIKAYFGVGGIHKIGSAYNYEVGSYKNCFESIIPFFTKYPFPSVCLKATNFEIWEKNSWNYAF